MPPGSYVSAFDEELGPKRQSHLYSEVLEFSCVILYLSGSTLRISIFCTVVAIWTTKLRKSFLILRSLSLFGQWPNFPCCKMTRVFLLIWHHVLLRFFVMYLLSVDHVGRLLYVCGFAALTLFSGVHNVQTCLGAVEILWKPACISILYS